MKSKVKIDIKKFERDLKNKIKNINNIKVSEEQWNSMTEKQKKEILEKELQKEFNK